MSRDQNVLHKKGTVLFELISYKENQNQLKREKEKNVQHIGLPYKSYISLKTLIPEYVLLDSYLLKYGDHLAFHFDFL